MKRVLSVIVCSIILLFIIFGLVKSTDKKETTSIKEEILIAEKNEYISEKNEQEIIKTDEIEEKKEEKKEEKAVEKKKNTTVKIASSKTNNQKNNINTKKNTTIKYGTYGRLYVSNYNVALYDYNVNTTNNKSLQTIVDEKDSAAYYETNGKLVIADHNYQGFNVLVNLNVGTTASIKFEDGKTIKYKLIKKSEGTNTGPDLIDKEGNSFFEMKSDIIMYTCYKNGIMVTLWTLA